MLSVLIKVTALVSTFFLTGEEANSVQPAGRNHLALCGALAERCITSRCPFPGPLAVPSHFVPLNDRGHLLVDIPPLISCASGFHGLSCAAERSSRKHLILISLPSPSLWGRFWEPERGKRIWCHPAVPCGCHMNCKTRWGNTNHPVIYQPGLRTCGSIAARVTSGTWKTTAR